MKDGILLLCLFLQRDLRRDTIFSMKKVALIFFVLVSVFVAIILYPQVYYFNDKIEYKNFRLYCDKNIPYEIYPILDEVDRLIRLSDCYDSHLKFKIFLRSDVSKYNLLPGQFPNGGFGQTISFIKNVFIYKADCATNTSYTHLGHMRTLSNVLAHELMHVLIENKWLFKSKSAYFDKNSLSEFGLWKEEGYAEYIAGGSSIPLEDGLKMLDNKVSIECVPQFEYFKYWLAVRHLIVKKHMTFEEILYAKLSLDDVLREARYALAL
jgi:hypothetical protein